MRLLLGMQHHRASQGDRSLMWINEGAFWETLIPVKVRTPT
ncbi:MAG TPA: hypothetical protein VIN06_19195 [Devosia sp.]